MTIVASTYEITPIMDFGTATVPFWWNEREARILASIKIGIEQAARGEGTELTDEDLAVDD